MKRVVPVVAMLCIAPVVRAASPVEPTRYLAGTLMFGAAEPVDNGYNVLAGVDGGYRVTGILWARAGLAYGTSIDRFGQHVPNGGRDGILRGGLEARWCAGTMLCGLAGADLGVQHGTWKGTVYSPGGFEGASGSTSDNALVVIPRVGLDFGGTHVRGRIALEMDTALIERVTTTTDMSTATVSQTGVIGIELAAGVAYQW